MLIHKPRFSTSFFINEGTRRIAVRIQLACNVAGITFTIKMS
jgi:hypothetical protein